jgi:hypothetical protein
MKRCFADLGYVSVGGAKDTRSAIRRAAYRIGRKLYMAGHMDLSNRPATNGEYWLVDQMLPLVPPDSVVLDIGANKGEWTAYVLRAASVLGRSLRVIGFEPCTATRLMLTSRFADEQRVEVLGTAVAAESGDAFFYANFPGSGTNSDATQTCCGRRNGSICISQIVVK